MKKKVLSLGQCAADNWSIGRMLETQFGVEVADVDTFADALAQLRSDRFALVLVNRILDRDGGSGLEFIGDLKKDDAFKEVPVMLVSNFADAQSKAVALGAAPGFGKSALEDKSTLSALTAFLAS